MLTIENITKVFRRDVGQWRIGKIETVGQAYLFQLMKSNGERMQVNLERNRIGNDEYELWHWKSHKGTIKPERMLVNKNSIETPDKLIDALTLLLM